ncbi:MULTISPECIES: transposase domain-containing protein [Bradyrhizobium]
MQTLATERDAAIAQRDAAIQENDKLLMILSQYKRTIFGPRSETLDIGQLSLFTIRAQAARAAANGDVTGGGSLTERRAVESDRRDASGGSFRSICRASMS